MLLYHYTNTAGLLGILKSQTLWASDAEYLNDAEELKYGRREMLDALRAEEKRILANGGTIEGSAEGSRASILSSAVHSLETGTSSYQGPYVVCFCSEWDLLSQWRGYAEGHGWALGFDADELAACATSWDKSESALQEITYGPSGIANAAQRAAQMTAPNPVSHPGVYGDYMAHVVCRRELARIKHPAFAEEKEWRLIVDQDGSVANTLNEDHAGCGRASTLEFRDGTTGLTPYLPVPWPYSALRELVIGPTQYRDEQRSAVDRLLGTTGRPEFPIRISRAPFR